MSRKKKILILNGDHSDIPLIQAAKKLGFYVITTGNIPYLIGHNYADEYHCIDFSNKDEILKLSQQLHIDYICSNANDFGAITASYVAEKMGIGGHDSYQTTLLLHQKDLFKKFAFQHQIPTPYTESFDNKDEALKAVEHVHFPLIIKPVDLSGGKGISKIFDRAEYTKAVIKAFNVSRVKRIIIEELIVGTEHSFSTFLINGKIVFYFSDNEYSYLNPYMVTTSAAPAINCEKVSKTLVNAVEKMANLLSLRDGIFHIQYIFANNRAKIIDITRRCSGDLYPYPVNYATHLDWAYWIVRAEAGLDCSDFPTATQTGYCGRYCIMSSKNGIVKNVIIDASLKNNIYDELFWWKKGDVIDNYLVQKLGIVMLSYTSMDEMIEKTNQLNNLIRVEIES